MNESQVNIDMNKVSDIPELTQAEREDIACLETDKEIAEWLAVWGKDRITEDLADKLLSVADLGEIRANPKAADLTDTQLKWGKLFGSFSYSVFFLNKFFKQAKNDFIKHIAEQGDSDFDLIMEKVFKEVEEFYVALCDPREAISKDNPFRQALKDDKVRILDIARLPTLKWTLRESISFLAELRFKKAAISTKDTQVNVCGHSFIFREGKLAEHISPTFDFNVEDWVKEHELKEVYGATGKPTALGLKLIAYRRYYFERDKQKIIAHDLGISQPSVAQWIDAIEYQIGYELGHAYEDFFARVRAPMLFKSYRKLGGNGEPDGIGELENGEIEIVSLKCYRESRNSVTISRKELRPEIAGTTKLVNAGKKAKLHLFFREHLRGYEEDRIVDVAKDEPETFSLPFQK